MRIGFQGKKNCYSFQVIESYLNISKIETIGFKTFENVFESINRNEIDYAVLPIENSIGGCIFVNYDLFNKYDIKIHSEFHHSINHSLYSLGKVEEIKKVISHPQAIQQCINNIKSNNFIAEEYWDTTGSLDRIKELNDKSIACIAPPNLSKEYGLNEVKTSFNDQDKNITRFYFISSKNKNLPNNLLKNNLIIKLNKFSGYIVSKDQVGILNSDPFPDQTKTLGKKAKL